MPLLALSCERSGSGVLPGDVLDRLRSRAPTASSRSWQVRRRAWRAGALFAAVLVLGGCRAKPRPATVEPDELEEPGAASVAAPAPSVPPAKPRCAPVTRGAAFTLGEADPGGDAEEHDLPFSVEIGRAVALERGFAIGALGALERGVAAFVALVGGDGASGRILDLGLTHGTFEPPVIAARGADLFLVVPDSDAGGNLLRLGVARAAQGAATVTWGPELSEGWDDSEVFDLALGAERGIVAWDRWDTAKERASIWVVDFDPADLSRVTKERALDLGASAEAPRLAPRPGGFWLAGSLSDARRQSPAAAARARGTGPGEEFDVIDREPRTVAVVPLDAGGAPIGKPLRVNAQGQAVVVFDLATLADGSALVAVRSDDAAPGAEGGPLLLARVALDGTVTREILDDDAMGPGAPALVADARRGGAAGHLWLALPGVGDEGALMALGADGRPLDALGTEAALGRGEALARSGDDLLIATSRGRAVEVSVQRCHPGEAPPVASAVPPRGAPSAAPPSGAPSVAPSR